MGNSFFGCLGKGFWGPGMERALIVSHDWLVTMMPPKVNFNRGDGIEAKVGLISGGSWGLEPPSWALGKSKNAGSNY